eukprot:scaffold495688_cov52-Prasinocladus_malaysianus.AAC.1
MPPVSVLVLTLGVSGPPRVTALTLTAGAAADLSQRRNQEVWGLTPRNTSRQYPFAQQPAGTAILPVV